MAKFKCIHTGCVYEWTEQETINNMRKHAEYVEVFPAVVKETSDSLKTKTNKQLPVQE